MAAAGQSAAKAPKPAQRNWAVWADSTMPPASHSVVVRRASGVGAQFAGSDGKQAHELVMMNLRSRSFRLRLKSAQIAMGSCANAINAMKAASSWISRSSPVF